MLNKTSISMGSHVVDLSATGTETVVSGAGAPNIGGLAMYNYKTAVLRYGISGGGSWDGSVTLKANGETLPQAATAKSSVEGADKTAGMVEVDLASLQGQTKIEMAIETTTAGTAGATLWAALDIEYASAAVC